MIITFPAFLFGMFMSAFYGAIFHLWKNGGLGRLLVFLFSSIVGFWVGHLIGYWIKLKFLNVGPIYFGFATLGSALFLVISHELSKARLD